MYPLRGVLGGLGRSWGVLSRVYQVNLDPCIRVRTLVMLDLLHTDLRLWAKYGCLNSKLSFVPGKLEGTLL